ncbi:hypothetical protein [Methylobacterium planeticum]|uniref:hypothetical protein n=1 Tax=Methylobacterium planeticum TaxID=2615211 RepID=UPI00177ACAB6|nr:hypothetical protein [Methylobacterium planeticum]
MRTPIRNGSSHATRILAAVALCLCAALVIVSWARTDSQIRGIEQFAVGAR